MKKHLCIFSVLLVTAANIPVQEKNFLTLTGPYLGQKPPVKEPVLFAPGIVSNGRNHSSVTISPDGKELYWSGAERKIWFTELVNGRWTLPEV
ncbi:MAG: hypothetical protein JW755_01745, partial [Candidatus Aminicenantes bacterium]|nr:hypothetical protein [Candidatus Aminicenantes bacterium]